MRIDQLWNEMISNLEKEHFSKGDFLLRLVSSEAPFKIFAGLDIDHKRLLALETSIKTPDILLETDAISYFRQQRVSGEWLLVLRLEKLELAPVFGRLCQDLIDTAISIQTQTGLVKFFIERLHLWKKLFQDGNNGLLEKHKIKGLLAELLALENLLDTRPEDKLTTLIAWTGPQKADQDFVFTDIAIEIKGISPSSTKIGISSIEQLEAVQPLELWVYILRDCGNQPDSTNLITQFIKIESKLSSEPIPLKLFRERMLDAGYVENEYYENFNFIIMDFMKFEVLDNFPRLTRDNIPTGIVNTTYSISIDALADFKK
jgi:hypothetical protein